jgi:four helix bundle protein
LRNEHTQSSKTIAEQNKEICVRVIKAFARLPKDEATRIIGRQFLRSGTSLAANYRASCRARSTADFISEISVVIEETDETLLWFEALVESDLVRPRMVESLMSDEIFFRVTRHRKIKSLNK